MRVVQTGYWSLASLPWGSVEWTPASFVLDNHYLRMQLHMSWKIIWWWGDSLPHGLHYEYMSTLQRIHLSQIMPRYWILGRAVGFVSNYQKETTALVLLVLHASFLPQAQIRIEVLLQNDYDSPPALGSFWRIMKGDQNHAIGPSSAKRGSWGSGSNDLTRPKEVGNVKYGMDMGILE